MVKFFALRKIKIAGLVLIGLGVLIALLFLGIRLLRPKVAGVYIKTNPVSSVYINGEFVGRTPYRATRVPGEIIVKLIPDSFQTPLVPYEAKITLVSGTETVLKRDFGELDETSAGELVSFEKVGRDETSLVVVTIPDSAQLIIDDKDSVLTPYKTSALIPGEHTLKLSAEGFIERTLNVKTRQGYKLTAVVKLAKLTKSSQSEEKPSSESSEQKNEPKVEIEIIDTGVGFLRVREEPSTLAKEVAKVLPGKRFPLVEEDEESGWFKIEYDHSKEGWVSNQFAKKVFVEPTETPTPKNN